MSYVQLDSIAKLTMIEPTLVDPSSLGVPPATSESFGDHLERAQAPRETTIDDGSDRDRIDRDRIDRDSVDRDSADHDDVDRDGADPAGETVADAAGTSPRSDDRAADEDSSNVPAEGEPSEKNQTASDESGHAKAETAEAGSQTDEGSPIDGRSVDPRPEVAVRNQDGLANGEAKGHKNPQRVAAKQQTENPSTAQQPVDERPATDGDPPSKSVMPQKLAAESRAEPLKETVEKPTDRAAGKDADPGIKQVKEQIRAAGEPQQAEQPLAETVVPAKSSGRSGGADRKEGSRQPSRKAAPNVAATPTPSDGRAASMERTILASEQTGHAAEASAEPIARAEAEGRPHTPVQPAPDQGSRSVSLAQSQRAAEAGQADRVRFVQRVADAFRAIGERNGSLRLRLSPPELGSLRLEISVRHGAMTARVEAETSTARNLLLDNLPALRDRLEQLDIKVQQFDVDLMDRSPGGLTDQSAGQMESDEHGQDSNAPQPGRETVAETDTNSDPIAVDSPGKGAQLNVVI